MSTWSTIDTEPHCAEACPLTKLGDVGPLQLHSAHDTVVTWLFYCNIWLRDTNIFFHC